MSFPQTYAASLIAALFVILCNQSAHAVDLQKISSNLTVFTDGAASLGKHHLIEVSIGRLVLPDGQLVAMDPLMQPDAKPYKRHVAPGTYPVFQLQGLKKRPGGPDQLK